MPAGSRNQAWWPAASQTWRSTSVAAVSHAILARSTPLGGGAVPLPDGSAAGAEPGSLAEPPADGPLPGAEPGSLVEPSPDGPLVGAEPEPPGGLPAAPGACAIGMVLLKT